MCLWPSYFSRIKYLSTIYQVIRRGCIRIFCVPTWMRLRVTIVSDPNCIAYGTNRVQTRRRGLMSATTVNTTSDDREKFGVDLTKHKRSVKTISWLELKNGAWTDDLTYAAFITSFISKLKRERKKSLLTKSLVELHHVIQRSCHNVLTTSKLKELSERPHEWSEDQLTVLQYNKSFKTTIMLVLVVVYPGRWVGARIEDASLPESKGPHIYHFILRNNWSNKIYTLIFYVKSVSRNYFHINHWKVNAFIIFMKGKCSHHIHKG